MEQIEITVAEYYARPWYYPFMPESIFKALEKAFLDEEPTALVSKIEFDLMMRRYKSQLAN
jgi:hypothetical protein